ncbi:hypothetical protein [Roseobacter sp. HKCCA0434]|uniref:hypothetical protein n=1 Tax=Roseobacter sp. HKCCA0434 TaxID=3079297 RepID=UPI002905A004|nr:hypothetical protein [Roseobacter sp. HKCCA0434]
MSDDTSRKYEGEAPESKGERERRRELEDQLKADVSVSQGGREGGRLPRDIGTQDEMKRAQDTDAGVTRVTKQDEEEK